MISTAEFRNGSPLMVEGQPFYIVEFQHVKPGKGGAFVRTKLKSYLSGNVLDRTFRSGEKFDTPQIEECDMQFLYATNDSYTFMDTETYEQSTYEKSQLGSNADLLKENMIAKILIYEHRPITVLLPHFIERLKRMPEGNGTVLDNTLVIYGSPMGDPNVHNHKRCPLLFAGHAGGTLKGGLHIRTADGTPMANAMLSLMHKLGMDDLQSFGDSTGEFTF